MKKIKLIDKAVYSCSPEVGRKYSSPVWWLMASAVGIGMAALYLKVPAVSRSAALSVPVLVLAAAGCLAVAAMVCYYLFGDCKRPHYRPNRTAFERYERYFDRDNAIKAGGYLMDGNFEAIAKLPYVHQSFYRLVMYRSAGGEVLCAQMVDLSGAWQRPMAEMEVFEKGAYELPGSLLLN